MMAGTAEGVPIPHLPPPYQMVSTGDEEKGLRPADRIFQAVKVQEMENNNSQNNAEEGGNSALGIEKGIFQPAPPDENGTSSTATTGKERNLDFDLKLSAFLITVSMIPLIDILFLHGPAAKLKLILKFTAFVAFTSFISAICLMFHTFKLMAIKPEHLIPKVQLRVSKILFAISVGSLFLTCISITYSLLPNKAHYFLPLALLPSLLVGGFHFLYAFETGGEISPAKIKALKKELKRAMQLSLSLVSTSFSGFIGVLLAMYHKADSLSTAYSYIKVSIYLLLGGGIAGAFALLLCRLLSSNAARTITTWQRAILAAADVAMIAMIVPAVLMIAETILHGFLIGTVFPVVAGAAAWLLVKFCTAEDVVGCTEAEEDGKAEHGTMYAMALAVATVSFGAIIAIFAGMLGGAVGKEQLKACTFFLTSAFVAAMSLGVVVTMSGMARAEKTKASTAFAAAVLTCCGLGTLVLAALALFYQIGA